MLGAEETERADFEEAENLSKGGLLLSRHEAWQEQCLEKSMQFADEVRTQPTIYGPGGIVYALHGLVAGQCTPSSVHDSGSVCGLAAQ